MMRRIMIGSLTGGLTGYLYYYFIGCYNGACLIKSDPVLMTVYGAVLGSLILELLHEARLSWVRHKAKGH